MFDEKQYKSYVETANFWVDIGERINNCIVLARNNTNLDPNFVEMVMLTLHSAEKMCIYRVNTLEEKAKALETLLRK